MSEGADPQILDNMVGNLIIDMVHQPLGSRGQQNADQNIPDDFQQSLKIHQSPVNNPVNTPAGENGDIESQHDRNHRQKQGENHQQAVGADAF